MSNPALTKRGIVHVAFAIGHAHQARAGQLLAQPRQRIQAIRQALAQIGYLCSGTLLARMNTCGKPNCRCAQDPAARHRPYYQWGHMKAGKLIHRLVSPEQAELLQVATANYRKMKKLMRTWETQTELIIDAEFPRKPRPTWPPRKLRGNTLADVRNVRHATRS